jgi:cysteine desulfurase
VFGVDPKTLFFTSGGTEADNLVLLSLLLRRGERGLAVSAIEHPAVAEPAERLAKLWVPVARVRPETDGRISAEALAKTLHRHPEARMAAVMAVNNETGAVQDIQGLVAAAREAAAGNIHFHCDAVQALGKTPLDLRGWGVDSAAFSAHKIGGPRGIGLLYLKRPLEVLYSGGGQEGGVRSGTENLFGALAMAACLEKYCRPETVSAAATQASVRWARLIRGLRSILGVRLIPEDRGDMDGRFSPWILQAAFDGIPGETFVRAMDDLGFSISTGSACSSRSTDRPVLAAMGVDEKTAFEAVRFSQGRDTTDEDIGALIEAIGECIGGLT